MIVRCLSFGSLWWLRPGNQACDTLRFSTHAAVFNTTGFVSGSRERRLWLVSGVVRINLSSHNHPISANSFENSCFQSPGPERRGGWNRVLLAKRVGHGDKVDRLLFCARSRLIGRIDFDKPRCDEGINVVAASALHGVQESLLLAVPGSRLRTDVGWWEITWSGIRAI